MIYRLLIIACALGGLIACDNSTSTDDPPPQGPDPNIYDWSLQNSGSINNYTDVYFVNDRVGWVVGENNTILSTVTGGTDWPEAPSNGVKGTFRSVHMIDEQRGWITGDMAGTKPDGSVYVSLTGGAYPETQQQMDMPMNTVFMLSDKLGWSGGENGQLFYTVDGKEWNASGFDSNITIYDLHFTDDLNGWLAGANGNIYRSKDGGLTWENEYTGPPVDLFSIHMIDSLQGWACGEGNTVLQRVVEGGVASWTARTVEPGGGGVMWADVYFVGEKAGWIIGEESTVYRTDNGGESWTQESTAALTEFNAIYMVTAKKGWIVGTSGTILTYTP